MSYNIYLLRKEVKEQNSDFDFFENEERIVKFTDTQFSKLRERLLLYKFVLIREKQGVIKFEHPFEAHGISVLLTKNYIAFRSSFSPDAVFEILMTASEFTDSAAYLVFNPQEGGWQAPF